MKYLFFRRISVRIVFRSVDFILGILVNKKSYVDPKRIIISNIAHMGDFVVSMPAIKKIIETFPNAEIGILCSNESLEIAKNLVNQENIYIFSHWKLNRRDSSFFNKTYRYSRDLYKLIRVLKYKKYDLAIDLYPYYPNSMFLLWLSMIRFRIGFSSGGLSNLCTLSYDIKRPASKHITQYQRDLLKFFFKKCLYLDKDWEIQKYFQGWSFTGESIANSEKYYVFQVGAGAKEKRWPAKSWAELIESLDVKIIIVGKGDDDLNYFSEIKNLMGSNKNVVSLINVLNFQNLVNLVSKSSLVVAGDSLLSHLAYGMNIPQLCILNDEKSNPLWINCDMKIAFKPNSGQILNFIKGL